MKCRWVTVLSQEHAKDKYCAMSYTHCNQYCREMQYHMKIMTKSLECEMYSRLWTLVKGQLWMLEHSACSKIILRSITIRLIISVFIAADNVLCWVDLCYTLLELHLTLFKHLSSVFCHNPTLNILRTWDNFVGRS